MAVALCRGWQRQHVEVAATRCCEWGHVSQGWGCMGHRREGGWDTCIMDRMSVIVVIGDGAFYRCVGVPVDANSHMTCLRPHINIRLCALKGIHFFTTTTSSCPLFTHQRSFVWMIHWPLVPSTSWYKRYVTILTFLQTIIMLLLCCFAASLHVQT